MEGGSGWPALLRVQASSFERPYLRRVVPEPDPLAYDSFNAFFTRALKPDARSMPEAPAAGALPGNQQARRRVLAPVPALPGGPAGQ